MYLLIASTPYAGSTLLAALLGNHPAIATVSEISGTQRQSRMATFHCSCTRLMVECPFWQEVQANMRAKGFSDFTLSNFHLRFDHRAGFLGRLESGSLASTVAEDLRDAVLDLSAHRRKKLRALGQRNQAFAETVMTLTGKPIFVDASKERMRVRHLHRLLEMEFRVVHLVRDVRAFVASSQRHGLSNGPGAAARTWTRTNQTIMRHLASLKPDDRMLVRYEDLCRDPKGTLDSLHAFCRVETLLASLQPDYRAQHLLGNDRRLEAASDIRLDERWRSTLQPGDLAEVWKQAKPLARSLYPDLRPE